MTLCSVDKLFIKKRSELPGEFWKNCVGHVKTVEESYNESHKIIDLQIEEVLIELGNESPESDNDVTGSSSECSESDFSIEHEYNKLWEQKGNKFCLKSFYFVVLLETNNYISVIPSLFSTQRPAKKFKICSRELNKGILHCERYTRCPRKFAK